jgi:hypothetical protein
MGSKHNKKRFLIVNYNLNAKGGYDELVELSKKKCGPGVPGQPNFGDLIPFESLYAHFHKAYGKMLDQFIK